MNVGIGDGRDSSHDSGEDWVYLTTDALSHYLNITFKKYIKKNLFTAFFCTKMLIHNFKFITLIVN